MKEKEKVIEKQKKRKMKKQKKRKKRKRKEKIRKQICSGKSKIVKFSKRKYFNRKFSKKKKTKKNFSSNLINNRYISLIVTHTYQAYNYKKKLCQIFNKNITQP